MDCMVCAARLYFSDTHPAYLDRKFWLGPSRFILGGFALLTLQYYGVPGVMMFGCCVS